eukprot:scaffold232183_cov52-Prasinocladus_malaysianus.AAC.1
MSSLGTPRQMPGCDVATYVRTSTGTLTRQLRMCLCCASTSLMLRWVHFPSFTRTRSRVESGCENPEYWQQERVKKLSKRVSNVLEEYLIPRAGLM